MFKLTFVTPEKRVVVDQEIEQVTLPALRGELNILPGHAPLVTTIETGVINWTLKNDEKKYKAVVSGGYCQVGPTGVSVLADAIDLAGEYQPAEADAFVVEAQKKLAGEMMNDHDYADNITRSLRYTAYKNI